MLIDTHWRTRVRKRGSIAIDARSGPASGTVSLLLTARSAQHLMDQLADALDEYETSQLGGTHAPQHNRH